MSKTGVFKTRYKNGSCYYRSSVTYHRKHISLGSFTNENDASLAHEQAKEILNTTISFSLAVKKYTLLSFEKIISLVNFRDNGIYIRTPIYLQKQYFYYYLSLSVPLKFDIEDLFYYSTHKIQQRNGYLFVSDYGMQINILSRYGIKNYAVKNRDYRHINQDDFDFTYSNIEIINAYYGVQICQKGQKTMYKSCIHLNGNFLIGYYSTEEDAAIAYNKAVDIVKKKGCRRFFQTNYILSLSASQYAERYHAISVSPKIIHWEVASACDNV